MQLVPRTIDLNNVKQLIRSFPVVAILGPRQCGKTTLAQQIDYQYYFDLENPRDLARLDQPQLALEDLEGLIVIDEIQRKPELFALLRYLVDYNASQKYLILGSASKDLIKQSSESLAGRIAYYNLHGFRIHDLELNQLPQLWLRGGLPPALLSDTEETSLIWRENYIATFLERDIPSLGIHIPAPTLRRFWTMLSHYHGQILNYAELGRSFGISDMTAKRYVAILESTFMLRILQPWHVNIGKRLVKQPKIYFRDSGLFHSLLAIENMNQLQSHPKLGFSWEGFALEMVSRSINISKNRLYFWRTHNGAELDLFWQAKGHNWGVEFKYLDAPRLIKSMRIAVENLELDHLWVIYPGKETYRLAENIAVLPLHCIPEKWVYSHP